MRDFGELGLRPRRRDPFPPTSAGAIAEFERRFAVRLPADYVLLLRTCNGGRSRLRVYDDPRGGTGEVAEFYGLGSAAGAEAGSSWDLGNLWCETQARRPWVGERGVPFGRDDGDNQLYLDYTRESPQIARLNSSTRQSAVLFRTFADFIDAFVALTIDPERRGVGLLDASPQRRLERMTRISGRQSFRASGGCH